MIFRSHIKMHPRQKKSKWICQQNESKWGDVFCLESNSPTQFFLRLETHAVPHVATNDKGCWKTTY